MYRFALLVNLPPVCVFSGRRVLPKDEMETVIICFFYTTFIKLSPSEGSAGEFVSVMSPKL